MNTRTKVIYILLALPILLGGGCQSFQRLSSLYSNGPNSFADFDVPPKIRIGSVPTPGIWTKFPNPYYIGKHGYGYSPSERSGIVYTCKGGHLDLVHLRLSADRTAYLTAMCYDNMMNLQGEFTFKFAEPSIYTVDLIYPAGWEELRANEKERLAHDAAIETGQYLSYAAGIWHEMVTWYGYKWTGVYNEKRSAFSWEDVYSNLLGTHLAAKALKEFPVPYEYSITKLLNAELVSLDVQPARVAKRTSFKPDSKTSLEELLFVDNIARNFDIGIDDGFVSPLVLTSGSWCQSVDMISYPIPKLNTSESGIFVRVRIEPHEWEKTSMLEAAYQDINTENRYIEPEIHFSAIMSDIVEQARGKTRLSLRNNHVRE
ncbi:MAG: DUF4056 domain-containing protein [Sedimentisphaerales bacterium]|nr:DUF4056 domain-containing protein [Sedimentisphaerales bacterium]